MQLLEIQPKDVQQLDSDQLAQLMHRLLICEAYNQIGNAELLQLYAPFQKITVKDGGEDGRIKFDREVKCQYLPKADNLFQSKASEFTIDDCAKEVLDSSGNVKERVKEVLSNGGAYILFVKTDFGANLSIDKRRKKVLDVYKQKSNTSDNNAEKKEEDLAELKIYKNLKDLPGCTIDQILVLDANLIADWTNMYYASISLVNAFLHRSPTIEFLGWERFYGLYGDVIFTNNFIWTENLKEKKEKLDNLLESSSTVRLIGYSGIGKTRFIGECFRPIKNHDQSFSNLFTSTFVYMDLNNSNWNELKNFLLNNISRSGVLVIDNCPDDVHEKIVGFVAFTDDAKIKVVTIDSDLTSEAENTIYIEKSDQELTCEKILEPFQEQFTKIEFESILEICDGYPYFALEIRKQIEKSGQKQISLELGKSELKEGIIKRLIAGSSEIRDFEKSNEYLVAQALSLFKKFPFKDPDFDNLGFEDAKFSESIETVISSILEDKVTKQEFYRIASKTLYRERKLVEPRGLTYRIRPEILAINLTAYWLDGFPPDDFGGLMSKLEEAGLIIEFCERLKSLDQIERARSLVEKYWGAFGPFAKAEVLKTEMGSRIFRSIVDVNPTATSISLRIFIFSQSLEELRTGTVYRRELVWALQKLAFRSESFKEAGLSLAKLALAENENYTNNATGQFLQLFKVILAGTEVDLKERVNLLEAILSQGEEYKELVIDAISAGIQSSHFTRSGGAEKQGTKILQDYYPNTNEIHRYWESILQIWVNLFENGSNDFKKLCLLKVEDKLYGLIEKDEFKLLDIIFKQALSIKDEFTWSGLIKILQTTLKKKKNTSLVYYSNYLDYFQPKGINKVTFEYLLFNQGHDYDKREVDGKETYVSLTLEKIDEFVSVLLKKDENFISNNLDLIFDQNAKQALAFGKSFATKLDEDETYSLIQNGLDFYKAKDNSYQNLEFVYGLFSGLKYEYQAEVISELIQQELYPEVLTIYRFFQPRKKDLELLIKLVQNESLSIDDFHSFRFGKLFDPYKVEDLIWFGNELGKIDSKGYIPVLELFYFYSRDNEFIASFSKDLIRWITTINMVSPEEDLVIDSFKWSTIVDELISYTNNHKLVEKVSYQILEIPNSKHYSLYDSSISLLLGKLFKNYFSISYPFFREVLIENSLRSFSVSLEAAAKNNVKPSDGVFFGNIDQKNYETIINDIKEFGESLLVPITNMMPIFSSDIDDSKELVPIHPFCKMMLEEFSNNDKFLDELYGNLHGFGWVGNVAGYYKRLLKLAQELKNYSSSKIKNFARDLERHSLKKIKIENLRHEEIYGR